MQRRSATAECVRSLMDSPGSSSDSEEECDNEYEVDDSRVYMSQVFDESSEISSAAFASTNNQDSGSILHSIRHHGPLHIQPSNATENTTAVNGDNDEVGEQSHHHQYNYMIANDTQRDTNTAVDSEFYRMELNLLKRQKENKKPNPNHRGTISRQSTFESTSTFQSDTHLSAQTSEISPARSRISLEDIDERSRQSSYPNSNSHISNANAPLVLGASSRQTRNTQGNYELHQRDGMNTLVLPNERTRIEHAKNAVLKNILSTVMPFSPMLSKDANLPTQQPSRAVINAASFAKFAPKAGYLSKLGSSVSEYKRRFFVLKPTTCLYYFISPNDEEPRGCIDLDGFVDPSDKSGMGGVKINSLGTLSDGRFRFECVFPLENKERDRPQTKKILLEARNEEVGREWMNALTVERLSYSKASEQLSKDQVHSLEKEMEIIEKRLEELKLVEKDLDGALEDCKDWQERSSKIDSAMYLLKRFLTKSTSPIGNDGSSDDEDVNEGVDKLSLSISKEEKELDDVELPGSYFASLTNACRGIKENLRLTVIETNTALKDLQTSNEQLKAAEERMAKAEKYICKLWEENCNGRESLKQKRNEKKILVNEVRALMRKSSIDTDEIAKLKEDNILLKKQLEKASTKKDGLTNANKELENIRPREKRQLSNNEMRLLFDLEEHVNTSLVQHEHLLRVDDQIGSPPRIKIITEADPNMMVRTTKKSNMSVDMSQSKDLPHKLYEAREGDSSSDDGIDEELNESEEKEIPRMTFSPLLPKQLSLIDQAVLNEAKEEKLAELLSLTSSYSLTSANLEAFEHHISDKLLPPGSGNVDLLDVSAESENDVKVHDRRNPLERLDADDSASGPSELSLKSLITDNGKATSKLVCPLKDVQPSLLVSSHYVVYSLTFYTPKIGLQFQKIPSNIRQGGLLTEAMTADVSENDGDSATATNRTEAELRLIASLSNNDGQSKGKNPLKDQSCPVLLPKHSVLVCGFNDFDSTSGNRKPSLGARLVGFDGISIERGPWTFEAVRKAIKARGRPLTLTFRDDYLTTEQRTILTQAACDVEEAANQCPKPRGRMHVPATIDAVSRSAKQFIVKSPSFSDVSREIQSYDDSTTVTDYSRSSENWRNFSDAGSSSVFSSRFTPLVSGLMTGLSSTGKKQGDAFTPEYFHRSKESLDATPHHRHFKAGLL